MDKISLITVTFRSEKTIADTIRSVNTQTYENIEHVIVDGASKDRTLEIVEREAQRNPKILSEPDKSHFDAYNKGLKLADGEIIGFLNSDDFYCSDKAIEEVMAAFQDKSVEAVYADLVYVDRDDTNLIRRHWKSKLYRKGMLSYGFHPPHPTLFLRRSVYDKAGVFDSTYKMAADVEFMVRAFHTVNPKCVYIPKIFVKMRDGGITGGSASSIMRQNREVLSGMRRNNIRFSETVFWARKFWDRAMQRVRVRLRDISKMIEAN